MREEDLGHAYDREVMVFASPYRKAVDAERTRLNKTSQSAWVATEILLERAYEDEYEYARTREDEDEKSVDEVERRMEKVEVFRRWS